VSGATVTSAEVRRAIADRDRETLRRWIAERGANLSSLIDDQRDATALHLAADAWDPEAVKMLLEAGADPRALDREGKTPRQRLDGVGDPSFMVQEIMEIDECRRLLEAAAGD
jgi:hypothetical protein